jgi:hypothetical protein
MNEGAFAEIIRGMELALTVEVRCGRRKNGA